MPSCEGILLLGPTGSGKSPLGRQIERRGLWGRSFRHFDFGESLRGTVAEEGPGGAFSVEDIDFLRNVLATGALLEDSHFYLAERILSEFLKQHCGGGDVEVVLNGLPRHVGQADAIDRIVRVHTVVELDCPHETVLERIGTNVGGDRTTRTDDEEEAVRRKLAIFAERTRPLVDHYRSVGTAVVMLPVSGKLTPEQAWRRLEERGGC